MLPRSKTRVILWGSEILNIQKCVTNQRMTSSWRNFRFLLFSPMSTYPPTFITIEHTLICVSKNHVFDDVIMTSRIFYKVGCIPITYRTLHKRNFEIITFRSRDMNIRSKIWIIHKKSCDNVITTWPWFSSITLPGILAYQGRTKSDLQFRRYGALKFAPLVWRHVTLDDVITTTRSGLDPEMVI